MYKYDFVNDADAIMAYQRDIDSIVCRKTTGAKRVSIGLEYGLSQQEIEAREQHYNAKIDWANGTKQNTMYEHQARMLGYTDVLSYKADIISKYNLGRNEYLHSLSVIDTIRLKAQLILATEDFEKLDTFLQTAEAVDETTTQSTINTLLTT